MLLMAEEAVLKASLKSSHYEHMGLAMSIGGSKLHVHNIRAWRGVTQSQATVLMVHGTAGSAMSAIDTVDRLTSKFTVHMIDLPGFGRSLAPRTLLGMSNPMVIHFYVDVLREYISKLAAGPVCVLAHSFGGFLAIALADRYPDLVERLVLVSPAGVFPTLGVRGAYWAVFFKLSLPQSLMRLLGDLGTFMRAWLPTQALYDLLLLSSPHGFADRFVGRFISCTSRPCWTLPAVHTLLGLSMPI